MRRFEWQANDFQNRSGIACEVTFDCRERSINKDAATALFRIFQETLTNVARHASATAVALTLKETGNELIMEVADNGRGITDEQIEDSSSFGIMGMRERANFLGGAVHLKGQHFRGTTVSVTIPLHQEGASDDTHSRGR